MTSKKSSNNVCNSETFELIYKEYITLLRNFLYYKFGDLNSAEDVAQNAFIKLWENCKKVQKEKAKSYLYTTAVNMSLNVIKHEKVVLKYQKKGVQSSTIQTPEYKMIEKEFSVKLQNAIDALTAKQREVFLLSRIEKKKYYEIAEMLNISVKAVEKRMHKALILLREQIGNV